jgi:hypothetical protein
VKIPKLLLSGGAEKTPEGDLRRFHEDSEAESVVGAVALARVLAGGFNEGLVMIMYLGWALVLFPLWFSYYSRGCGSGSSSVIGSGGRPLTACGAI